MIAPSVIGKGLRRPLFIVRKSFPLPPWDLW